MTKTSIEWVRNPDGSQGYTWNPIPEHKDYFACREGLIASSKRGTLRIMSPIRAKDGHLYVFLYSKGKMVKHWTHRLLLTTFSRMPEIGEESRHLNGVPDDNRIENLIWGTRVQNWSDRIRHGKGNQGEQSGTHKLTSAQVIEIRKRLGRESSRVLGREYGVSHTTILAAANGHHWREL